MINTIENLCMLTVLVSIALYGQWLRIIEMQVNANPQTNTRSIIKKQIYTERTLRSLVTYGLCSHICCLLTINVITRQSYVDYYTTEGPYLPQPYDKTTLIFCILLLLFILSIIGTMLLMALIFTFSKIRLLKFLSDGYCNRIFICFSFLFRLCLAVIGPLSLVIIHM